MTAESIVLQNRVSMAHAVAQQRATTKTTITITNTAQRQLIIIRQRFGVSNLNSRAISSHGNWCASYAQAGMDSNVTVKLRDIRALDEIENATVVVVA